MGTHRQRGASPVILLALFLTACLAQPPHTPTLRALSYPVSRSTLPSGMRVVFEVSPDFGTAGVVLVIATGSTDDPSGKGGLAHLVEHLVFEARHGDSSFRRKLETLGAGYFNGMTGWDETRYFAFGPEKNLQALIALFGDVLADPLASVDEATFDHERQVVRDEMQSHAENGTPSQAFGLLASTLLPAENPYAHPALGTEESIARLTLADARAFAKAHYGPALSVLAVSSPLPIESQKDLLAGIDAAHSWAAASPVLVRPGASWAEDALTARQPLHVHVLPVSTPALWIGWSLPPGVGPQADVAALASSLIEWTFWSHVDDHDSDIAYVDSGVATGRGASLLYVVATLKEGDHAESSADSLVRTMRRGLAEETYKDWFSMAKRNVATKLADGEDPIVSRTLNLAQSIAIADDPTYLRARAERTIAIDPSVFSHFYHRYLSAERARAVLIRPLDRPMAQGAAAGGRPGVTAEGERREDLPPPPAIADVREWMRAPRVSLAQRATLRNGLEVVALKRTGSPFHAVVRAYHGGRVDEQVPGVAVASLWAKDRLKVSSATWGVEYDNHFDSDTTYEILRAAGSDVDFTLKELDDENNFRVLWPPRQFSTRIEAYERQERAADAVFDRRMRAAFYGTHPYGRWATTADIHAVTPRAVDVYLDSIGMSDNGIVVVVADIDPAAAIRIAASHLGGLGGAGGATPKLASLPALERSAAGRGERLVVQDRPGSDSARMRFMCALPRIDPQGWGVAEVFAQSVEGGLHDDLRERTASSYGVGGDLRMLRGGTAVFELNADVDHAHLPRAIGALRRFLEQPARAVIDDGQLARSKGAAAFSFNLMFGTARQLALEIVSMWSLGWPIDTLDLYPEQVLAAKLADVLRLTEHCQENWVLGLIGDEARIHAAVGEWKP
jgi:zinc protease